MTLSPKLGTSQPFSSFDEIEYGPLFLKTARSAGGDVEKYHGASGPQWDANAS
jgi:hypothetical protein